MFKSVMTAPYPEQGGFLLTVMIAQILLQLRGGFAFKPELASMVLVLSAICLIAF